MFEPPYDEIKKYLKPFTKIVNISGEPGGLYSPFVHLMIDCTRDPVRRVSGVPHKYLPFFVQCCAERFAHPRELLIPPNFDAKAILKSKSRFCAFMYSNEIKHRNEFYDAVKQYYKSPDALGSCRSDRSKYTTSRFLYKINEKTYMEDAVEQYRPYKFVIAMENERVLGYMTEKFVNPTFARCVPIYLGAPDIFDDGTINRKAMIHIADYPSYEACVEHIKKVDQDDELYMNYLKEPLFVGNRLPRYFDSDFVLQEFMRVFGQ